MISAIAPYAAPSLLGVSADCQVIGVEKGFLLEFSKAVAWITRRSISRYFPINIIYDAPYKDPYQDVFVSLFCSGQVALRAYTGGSIVLKSAFRNASSVILRMSPSIITGLLYRLFSAVKVDKPSKWCEIYRDLNQELIAFLSLNPISCRFGVASKETCNASPSILRGCRCLYPPCDRVQISDLMRSSYRLDFLIDLESSRSTVLNLFLKLLTVHKLNII